MSNLLILDKIDVSKEEVFRSLGTKINSRARLEVDNAIERQSKKASELISPRALFKTVRVAAGTDGLITLSDTLRIPFIEYFTGASGCILVVGTVGEELEHETSRLFNHSQHIDALVLNEIGIIMLDKLMESAKEHTKGLVGGEGMRYGFALSPGCHNIPLDVQSDILAMVEADRIGITVTHSNLMIPLKSYSLLIPFGKNLKISGHNRSDCEICSAVDTCPYRKLSKASQRLLSK
ncbi:hypothetical protein [Desulfoscipio geothermicus]|uniref:Vitamin B12 dependent methionine synthase, activation domain n=1 Tax=Desulfoscipio geothermicus DSM 3669 TaxID=1121426 RepID=A0A1I6DEH6_9FIRM|nr:hypothetical protein [Desulfoscipio geothermicus]SFR03853.1 hypothetical protein SAMN05660706_109106 [Desulfoscipio geothermicus DSM 3669]